MLFGKVDALKETISKREPDIPIKVVEEEEEKVQEKPGTSGTERSARNDGKIRELEGALKKWATSRMRENYEDFERLLTAKNAEVRALITS